jgi:ArsR family transcriptional regulator
MHSKTIRRNEARALVLKAMAHPTRMMIIEALSKREHCVCELTDLAGADISTVSKHLALMKSAGLVEDDKRGQMVFYRLTCTCIMDFIACVENVVRQKAKAQLAVF